MSEAKTLFGQIAKVMAEVRSLPKNGHNQQSRYDYVTSDDALEHIGKAMSKHGVIVIPTISNYESITEGKMTRTRAEFIMHICGETGETFAATWFAEGIDYGNPDKALTKAMTYGTKTFLLKLFVVGAGGDDPDGESAPAEQPKSQPANGKPPQVAKAPAKKAAPVDPEKARKAFHASGTELFGKDWNTARPLVVERYSANKQDKPVRTSSKALEAEELAEIAGTFTSSESSWKSWLKEIMTAKEAAPTAA